MNRLIGTLAFIILFGISFSQNIDQSNVPAVILNSFQLKLPNAEDIEWELEDGNYQVECKVNNKLNKLILDNKGKILFCLQDLYISEIPKIILETIRTKVAYFDINDADKIEENGEVIYEIDFKIDGKTHLFRIDEKGAIVKYRKELKNSEIPASIFSIINSKFGDIDIKRAKYVEDRGNAIYILRGEINNVDYAFRFDNKPTLIIYSKDLKNSEIPAPVINTITTAYSGFEIRDADLINKKGDITYLLVLRKSKEKVKVTFNPKGKILEIK